MSKATVTIMIRRRGTRATGVEFEDEMDAEKLYLDLVENLKSNDLVGEREVKHMLIGKPGVTGSGLSK